VFDDPAIDRVNGSAQTTLALAKHVELHGRIAEGSATDHPVIESVLRIEGGSLQDVHPLLAQPFDADVRAKLSGLKDFSPKPWPQRFREIQAGGGHVEIVQSRVAQGDVIAVAAGTLGLSAEGRLDGELQMTVAGLEKVIPALGIDKMLDEGVPQATLDRVAPLELCGIENLRASDLEAPRLLLRANALGRASGGLPLAVDRRSGVEGLDLAELLEQRPFERQHGRYEIRGLRDPLAAEPQALLSSAGLEPRDAEFHWAPYYAMDDAILEKRASALLHPPSGVNLKVTDGVLRPEGEASTIWEAEVRNRAPLLPGIRSVDFSQLTDTDQAEFNRLQNVVQVAIIRFPLSSATPTPEDLETLRQLTPQVRSLFEKAQLLHKNVEVDIVGHSDSSGEESTNIPLSQSRADRVLYQLTRDGIARAALRSRGVASAEPLRKEENEEARQYNRSVTFRITAVSSAAVAGAAFAVPSHSSSAGSTPATP